MDIMFTVGGIHTLANVVIIEKIHAFLVLISTSSWGMATMIIAHAMVVSYCDLTPYG
jgi:hypothetical protein